MIKVIWSGEKVIWIEIKIDILKKDYDDKPPRDFFPCVCLVTFVLSLKQQNLPIQNQNSEIQNGVTQDNGQVSIEMIYLQNIWTFLTNNWECLYKKWVKGSQNKNVLERGASQTKGLHIDSWVRHWADIDHPFPRLFLGCFINVFLLLNFLKIVKNSSIKLY